MATREVLVVEDDDDIREALLDVLEDHGFEGQGAANGSIALNLLKASNKRPCAIVLDLMMPVMDGSVFRMKQLELPELASIPVIVVTAYRDAHERVAALNPAAMLKKPLDMHVLVAELERLYQAGQALPS